MQILTYGAPGAGKTTSSMLLHAKTGLEVYEGDYLKEVKLPKVVGKSDDPFLYIGTKQAWRQFGKLSANNAIKGLLAVRKSMHSYIQKELVGHQDIIFEAAFLDPEKLPESKLYLVVTLDESKHREQFFRERKFFHSQYSSQELEEGFKASRFIQAYLIQEAQKLKVTIVHNDSDEGKLLSQFRV